jgi:uncharacterized membrane protein
MSGDAHHKIEIYLSRLRQRLRRMKDEDVREIIAELRSHITEKSSANGEITSAGVDAALAALGSPEDMASQYLTDDVMARAEVSRSPVQILKSLFHWASLSIAGFFVLLGSLLGYFLGAVFILVAAFKPFHPKIAGLWLLSNGAGESVVSLRLGFGSAPENGREILGWSIIPLGMCVGCGLVMLTTYSAVWCVRQYRRSRILPQQ